MLFQYGYEDSISSSGVIISIIISIIVAYTIAKDARTRGIEPTGYVILTCCCGWCIGGIVYLIVRSSHPPLAPIEGEPGFSSSSYPGYRQSDSNNFYGRPDGSADNFTGNSSDSTYRPSSGIPKQKTCSMCGSLNPIDARFCSNCGSNMFDP
ncbi:zinc-ribbon domain-containing protein [Candidatus Harpocratesius sp.]